MSFRGKVIHVLIDLGATHNFINLETGKRLGCQLEPISSLQRGGKQE